MFKSYICYDAYVRAHKGPHNETICYRRVANNYRSYAAAQSETNNYYINEKVDWLRYKGTSECTTSNDSYVKWIVGIVFFVFLLALFAILIDWCSDTYNFVKSYTVNAFERATS
jgi:hypothetical protein